MYNNLNSPIRVTFRLLVWCIAERAYDAITTSVEGLNRLCSESRLYAGDDSARLKSTNSCLFLFSCLFVRTLFIIAVRLKLIFAQICVNYGCSFLSKLQRLLILLQTKPIIDLTCLFIQIQHSTTFLFVSVRLDSDTKGIANQQIVGGKLCFQINKQA